MKRKTAHIIALVCCSFAAVLSLGVGYSSWNITRSETVKGNVNIDVDSDVRQYIALDESKHTEAENVTHTGSSYMTKVTRYGFDPDGSEGYGYALGTRGDIVVYLKLMNSAAAIYNTLNVSLAASSEGYKKLLPYCTKIVSTFTSNGTPSEKEVAVSETDKVKIPIPDGSSQFPDIYVTVKFPFNVVTSNTSEFFTNLSNNTGSFKFSATLSHETL